MHCVEYDAFVTLGAPVSQQTNEPLLFGNLAVVYSVILLCTVSSG